MPYWSDIERMSLRRAPLPAYAPASPSGQIYSALWQEIQARMAQQPRAAQVLSETEPDGAEPDHRETALVDDEGDY